MTETHSDPFSGRSPRDGSPLDPVTPTALKDVAKAVRQAATAAGRWQEKEIVERARTLHAVKQRLLSRADELAALVSSECGKPTEEALLAEVLPNADLVDYWCTSAEELLAPTVVELDPLAYPGKVGQTIRAPRGVVGLITPWNYPVAIPLRTIVPALLAGNGIVFKPSEITPRSGAFVASLFDGLLPKGTLQLIQGDGEIGAALCNAEVDLVVFTGSVSTGRAVAKACAERLIPCSLELGGKDAAIVASDADLERTARGLVWGAFTNAGQNCASIERVYVVETVADELEKRIKELTGELTEEDLSVFTTERQRDHVRQQVRAALESGAELLAGELTEEDTLNQPPLVLRVDDDDSDLMQQETFGPVMPIARVADIDEAVKRTNESAFALTTSIWTRDFDAAHAIARSLRSGVVTINNHGFTAALPSAPWTGTGHSGYGITNGPEALAELTRPRFILEDRNRAKSELWWYRYTPALREVANGMVLARGGKGLAGRFRGVFSLLANLPKRLLGS